MIIVIFGVYCSGFLWHELRIIKINNCQEKLVYTKKKKKKQERKKGKGDSRMLWP